jgi:hypothetical protein
MWKAERRSSNTPRASVYPGKINKALGTKGEHVCYTKMSQRILESNADTESVRNAFAVHVRKPE